MTFRNRFRNQLADVLSNVFGGTTGGGGGVDPDSIILWDMTSDGSGAPPVEADASGNGWQGSYGGSGQTFNGDSVTFTTASSNNLSVDTPSIPVGTSGAPSEFTVLMKMNALTTGSSNVLFVIIGPGGGTNSYTFIMWSTTYQVYDGAFRGSGVAYNAAHRNIAVRFINDVGTQKYELYIDGAIVTASPVTLGTKDLTACDFFVMSNNAGGQSTAGEVARTEIIGRNMSTAEIDAWFEAEVSGRTSTQTLAALAAETDTLSFIAARGGLIYDYAGGVTSWLDKPTVSRADGMIQITDNGYSTAAGSSAIQLTTGDMTIRTQLKLTAAVGAIDTICAFAKAQGGGGDETEAGNTTWMLYFQDSSTVVWFHENGAGANESATFTLPSAVGSGDELTLSARRVDNLDGTCTVELWGAVNGGSFAQLTLAATSGTDNGDDTATMSEATGGGSGWINLKTVATIVGQELAADMRFLQIKDAVLDDSAESTAVANIRSELSGLLA